MIRGLCRRLLPVISAAVLAPLLAAQVWEAAGTLNAPLYGESLTLLADGRVLVAAGFEPILPAGQPEPYPPAMIYDPRSGGFTPTGSLNYPRAEATGVLLPSGRVMILGGLCLFCPVPDPPPEIFDPASGRFSLLGAANTPGSLDGSIVTPLKGGKYLTVSGAGKAWLYDPAANQFSAAGAMLPTDNEHCQAPLPNGDVLLIGGLLPGGAVSPNAPPQVYHADTGQWQTLSTGPEVRNPACVLLPDGKVLVAGGDSLVQPGTAAELFDPGTQQFLPTGILRYPGFGPAYLLPSGRALIVRGLPETYDPASGTFSQAGAPPSGNNATAQLADGSVLYIGDLGSGPAPAMVVLRFREDISNPFSFVVPTAKLPSGFGAVPIVTTSVGSFHGGIGLTCLIGRVPSCLFAPNPVTAGQTAAMNMGLLTGDQTVTVIGQSGIYSFWATNDLYGPELAIGASPASQSVQSGVAAQYKIALGSLDSFPVTLSCSNLPAHAGCSFAHNPVEIGPESPRHTTLTIATDQGLRRGAAFPAAPAILFGLALLAVAPSSRRRRREGALALVCAALLACGGSPAPPAPRLPHHPPPPATTPKGTYAITVTAKYNPEIGAPVRATTEVTLVVQ